ncbi:MAG: aconitase X [Candidatus Asgardarchaeia archaeon]
MYLTKEEERMLNGEYGKGVEKAMRILVTLGDIYNAEKMIPISSAQISGISYKSIGDAGTEFLEDFANSGVKVRVTATMNPAGMDLEDWKKMGIPEDFAKNQLRIINALTKMGVIPIPSCTPYFHGFYPRFNEHVAWAESSAVAFVNSVIGARTNREGGPSALAAAITGRTPYYGLHIKENRAPKVAFKVNTNLVGILDFSLLGYFIGLTAKKEIPFIYGVKEVSAEELRSLGAGMASSGGIPMFHMDNITPESKDFEVPGEVIEVESKELEDVREKITTSEDVDLVALGCPHLTIKEIMNYYNFFKSHPPKHKVWLCTSRPVKEFFKNQGIVTELEKLNVLVVADTCMVVAPLEEMGIKSIGLDSTKAAHYSRNLSKLKVKLGKLEEII